MKNKRFNELAVCGIEAVKALERAHPEAIRRFYFNDERAPLFGGLCKKLAARKAPYNCVEDDSELEKLCGSVHHQGVVAMINQPEIPRLSSMELDQWAEREENILVLDRIGNANNLGAIVRSAAFFGTVNVIIPLDDAQSSITTSSYRIAQGGMEFMNMYAVSSISRLLKDVEGKFIRIGTDIRARASISQLPGIIKESKKPVTLVLGNEEMGISPEVKLNCDYLVAIQGKPFYTNPEGTKRPAVESLNVAQAAALCLYIINNL